MSVVISGLGIVSAAGIGVGATIATMRAKRCTVSAVRHFATVHKVAAAEVEPDNDELARMLHLPEGSVVSRTAMLGMLAAREAVDDAALTDAELASAALVSATTVGGMDRTQTFFADFVCNPNSGRLRYVRGHDCADSTRRIAEHCGIGGFATTISTACSSSANAIMLGARMIEAGLADVVVAGGCDALCPFTLNGFRSLMILDEQPCRPFDRTRSGLNLGEGAAYVVMRREAERHYCYVSGMANANDAFHQTASSAEGNGAFEAMRRAVADAGLQPHDVDYVNVHGTGTPNNDASEAAAMMRLWHNEMPAFSSTKAFTGHTLAAAGAVEAVLSALSVSNGYLYPNLNFSEPIEDTQLVPQQDFAEGVRVDAVLSNSFGFGGNCTSLLFTARPCPRAEVTGARNLTCYVNGVEVYGEHLDAKQLIPDANMRRRMSRCVKMGVATGMACMAQMPAPPDAIVTATGLGCLADSEKFLRSVIVNAEQMINPTPFIQSTFNTVGGQIAIISANRCYNMTYVHRYESFETALADAMLKIAEGAEGVLLGAFDEMTETQVAIMRRMGVYRSGTEPGEGAVFFALGSRPCAATRASLRMDPHGELTAARTVACPRTYHTAQARTVADAIGSLVPGEPVRISLEKTSIVIQCARQ